MSSTVASMQVASSTPSKVSDEHTARSSERIRRKQLQQDREDTFNNDEISSSSHSLSKSSQLSNHVEEYDKAFSQGQWCQYPLDSQISQRQLKEPISQESKHQTSQEFGAIEQPNHLFAHMTTRKRQADLANLDEDQITSPQRVSEALVSPNNGDQILPSQICLCQKDPKIPRPRNAFILYRQHHHNDILTKYPGIPNPEVSKIAGQLWAKESDHVKDEWKRLAEEEKNRHAQQYPEYKFQPKHKSRRGTNSSTLSNQTVDRSWCPKCGGRTTSGSIPPSPNVGVFHQSPPPDRSIESNSTPSSRTVPQIKALTLDSSGVLSQKSLQFPPLETPIAAFMENSNKKRRLGLNQPSDMDSPREDSLRLASRVSPRSASPESSGIANIGRRESLPPPTSPALFNKPGYALLNAPPQRGIYESKNTAMAPPPAPRRQSINSAFPNHVSPTSRANSMTSTSLIPNYRGFHSSNSHQSSSKSRGLDSAQTSPLTKDSLRLPPINQNSVAVNKEVGRSIESVIMSIDYLLKIKIIRQIAKPIRGPFSAQAESIPPIRGDTHTNAIRGSFIAIEGDKDTQLHEVLLGLQDALNKTGEFNVKVIQGPKGPPEGSSDKATYSEFLQEVERWHSKAQMLHDFITGAGVDFGDIENCESRFLERTHNLPDNAESQQQLDPNSMDIDNSKFCISSGASASTKRVIVRRDSIGSGISQESALFDSAKSISSITSNVNGNIKIPILLIPGYILNASNIWAAELPLTDSYSVLDHWSWVATVWRALPGADFTVYVHTTPLAIQDENIRKRSNTGHVDDEKTEQSLQSPWNNQHSDLWSSKSSVEILENIQTFVIRGNRDTPLEGSTIRRVAFEIGEGARLAAGRNC